MSDESKKDLTKITDLSEFEHIEDTNIDNQLESFESAQVEDLEDLPESEELESFEELEESPSFDQDDFNNDETLEDFSEDEPTDPAFNLDVDALEEFEEEEPDIAELASELEENIQVADNESIDEEIESVVVDESPKDFEDVKVFAKNISYGKIAAAGNPPYGIILENIKYTEERDEIFEIIKKHGLINPNNQADIKKSLEFGKLLLSQISEYAAIYLSHQFRVFELDMMVGLSQEIRPSKHYDNDEIGKTSKERIFSQNKKFKKDIIQDDFNVDDIIITTTNAIYGMNIENYLGIINTNKIISKSEFENPEDIEEVYSNLAIELKTKAFEKNANAVVGVNYQATPLISDELTYQISCHGNAVWSVLENE